MNARRRRLAEWVPFSIGALLLTMGCASSLPPHIFALEAEDFDYPVMVSSTVRRGGRPFHVESGMSGVVRGNSNATTTTTSQTSSELGASAQLRAQVARADRWVQIERLEFHASDVFAFVAASEDRRLFIKATAQR
jgi:hypothetical protein